VCENTCEWGAIRERKIVVTECVRCDDCELLYADRKRCPHWLLKFKREARAATEGQGHTVAVPVPRPGAARRRLAEPLERS
jgi:hypothetical protein